MTPPRTASLVQAELDLFARSGLRIRYMESMLSNHCLMVCLDEPETTNCAAASALHRFRSSFAKSPPDDAKTLAMHLIFVRHMLLGYDAGIKGIPVTDKEYTLAVSHRGAPVFRRECQCLLKNDKVKVTEGDENLVKEALENWIDRLRGGFVMVCLKNVVWNVDFGWSEWLAEDILCEEDEIAQRNADKMLAFCMGLHWRLGQSSRVLQCVQADAAGVIGSFVLGCSPQWGPAALLRLLRDRRAAKGLPAVLKKYPYQPWRLRMDSSPSAATQQSAVQPWRVREAPIDSEQQASAV